MTNEEKAGRLAGKYFDGRRQKGTFQMAKSLLIDAMKWKDRQFKEIIAQVRKWLDEQGKLDKLDLVEFDMETDRLWEGKK